METFGGRDRQLVRLASPFIRLGQGRMETTNSNAYTSRGGVIRIWKACSYSIDGFVAAFRFEAAFRQLVALASILIPVAIFLPIDRLERTLLAVSMLLSLTIELLDSAIEAAVDRISNKSHLLSKQAKDMGSAAQMPDLINIAVVWGIVPADLVGNR
jgi:diacylglycerol kinase (ATP)